MIKKQNNIGVLDIGSNAIRWFIAAPSASGYDVIKSHRESIRLGEDVFLRDDKSISEEKIIALAEAATHFVKACAEVDARPIAVATSACRDARNRKDLLKRVKEACGLSIDVIDGTEEARYIFLAVRERLDLRGKAYLLMDIGGGSVEFSLTVDGEVVWSTSVSGGGVRFLQLFSEVQDLKFNHPEYEKRLHFLHRIVRQNGEHLIKELRSYYAGPIDGLIGTGGNFDCMENMCDFLFGEGSGVITARRFRDYNRVLKLTSRDELISEYMVRPDRADILLPATVLVELVLKMLFIPRILIPKVGLRDGVVVANLSGGSQASGEPSSSCSISAARLQESVQFKLPDFCAEAVPIEDNLVHNSALALGKRFSFDLQHGSQVQKLASMIYEGLRLDGPRELLSMLKVAALLHDIGRIISSKGHHKHSYYIIKNSPLFGLTADQKHFVASLARAHRKSFPKSTHESVEKLSECYRPFLPFLAAILRIADALDREHLSKVERVELHRDKTKYRLEIFSNFDCDLEAWNFKGKKALFEEIFKAEIVLERRSD